MVAGADCKRRAVASLLLSACGLILPIAQGRAAAARLWLYRRGYRRLRSGRSQYAAALHGHATVASRRGLRCSRASRPRLAHRIPGAAGRQPRCALAAAEVLPDVCPCGTWCWRSPLRAKVVASHEPIHTSGYFRAYDDAAPTIAPRPVAVLPAPLACQNAPDLLENWLATRFCVSELAALRVLASAAEPVAVLSPWPSTTPTETDHGSFETIVGLGNAVCFLAGSSGFNWVAAAPVWTLCVIVLLSLRLTA